MFEDMFTFMFTPYLNTCFHQIWRFVYTMSENICAICLETSLTNVWIHVSTVFKDMFTPCLTTYFYIVWFLFTQYFQTHLVSLIYIMFQDVLTLCMKTCLLKDNQLMAFFETFEPIFIKNWSNCSFGWKWIKNQYNLV